MSRFEEKKEMATLYMDLDCSLDLAPICIFKHITSVRSPQSNMLPYD